MAANNTPSLINPLDPTSALPAYEIQRKQALAQALQQQALQPMDKGQMVSGWYVPPSIFSGINKVAQQFAANYLGKNASEDAGALQAKNMQAISAALDPNGPSQAMPPAAAATNALQMGAASGAPAPAQPSMTGEALQPGQIGAEQNRVGPTPMSAALMNQMTQPKPGATGSPLNPLGMNKQLAAYMLMNSPDKFYELQGGAYKPTDATMMARQAGKDPRQANADVLAKQTYIAPVNARPGSILRNPLTMAPMAYNPHIPDGGMPLFDASGNVASVQPLPGATNVVSGMAAAQETGKGTALPFNGFDVQGNPMPTTSRTAAVTQTVPNAGFPAGTQVPGSGQDTGSTMNILQQERQQIAAQPDSPNKAGDLAAIDREIARTSQRSPIYGTQAPGVVANANAQAQGQVSTMQDSYKGLQTTRAGGAMALQDLGRMMDLASGKSPLVAGETAAGLAGLVSSNAAEYEKSRDNLVTNLGSQLGMGTDAARALVYGSVPAYGAPKQAITNGLKTLQGQVHMRMLKADYLSGAYGQGDPKNYNALDNQFDQHVTPELAGIAAQPSGPQRAAALKAAASNPQMRARLEWMAQNGILK